jgi:hypothetical protein
MAVVGLHFAAGMLLTCLSPLMFWAMEPERLARLTFIPGMNFFSLSGIAFMLYAAGLSMQRKVAYIIGLATQILLGIACVLCTALGYLLFGAKPVLEKKPHTEMDDFEVFMGDCFSVAGTMLMCVSAVATAICAVFIASYIIALKDSQLASRPWRNRLTCSLAVAAVLIFMASALSEFLVFAQAIAITRTQ